MRTGHGPFFRKDYTAVTAQLGRMAAQIDVYTIRGDKKSPDAYYDVEVTDVDSVAA